MKKNFLYAVMSAIALTGAVSLTSCSSNEDAADVNPTFDGTSVRTDFAFSITKASPAQTRQGGAAVQDEITAQKPFRGLSDMYLFPFKENPSNGATPNANKYSLGALTTSDISATNNDSETSSKVYSLTIPVGTTDFLFYGTATRSSETNFAVGKLTNTLAGEISTTNDIHFSLVKTVSNKDGFNADAAKIASYLTAIANASDATAGTWAATKTTAESDGTYRALAMLYDNFTINAVDFSGSGESLKRMILDLYKSAKAINQQSSVENIQKIAKAICDSINDVNNNHDLQITISEETPLDPDTWTAACTGFEETFPSNYSLPMGAAQLSFSGSAFTYKSDPNYAVVSSGNTAVNLDKICYPAELVYFDNSPLRATSTYHQAGDYPKTANNWDKTPGADGSSFSSDWTETSVSSTTRAVAMQNNVNYGVALLKTTVKLASTSLKDNMKAIVGGSAEDQTITAVNGTNTDPTDIATHKSAFTVTGILIGGQPSQVGWNMINSETSGTKFANVIYDNDITFKSTALGTSYTDPNYTIVFDNYDASKTEQSNVLIALQIKNDGCDFYGKNGLIPAGSTFYLAGTLDLSGKSFTKATRPGSYRITNENIKRVFVQDYETDANITINTNALKNAYSVIPDLRSTEVLFGLSVELKWEKGIEFGVSIGTTE